MEIIINTGMDTVPKSCQECSLTSDFNTLDCRLPWIPRTGGEVLRTQYLKKRHFRCPLKEGDNA